MCADVRVPVAAPCYHLCTVNHFEGVRCHVSTAYGAITVPLGSFLRSGMFQVPPKVLSIIEKLQLYVILVYSPVPSKGTTR
jgi:hypothetical protein